MMFQLIVLETRHYSLKLFNVVGRGCRAGCFQLATPKQVNNLLRAAVYSLKIKKG